jgi:acid phosphatase family membrane protein YuiD
MQALWSNDALWLPVSAALFAQLLKPFWWWWSKGRFTPRAVLATGGMPSSHSAMMTSLFTVLGYRYGLDSPLFAIAAVVSLIVMYDARGVRQESGKQAKVLNQLMREFFSGRPRPISEEELKELLGHTSVEVVVGALLGIGFALAFLVGLVY